MLVLERGEELIATLHDFAKTNNLTNGWLLSGVGGAEGAVISYYDFDRREYIEKDFEAPLEILSLQGNLSLVDNEPFWHIHGTFSGTDFSVIGGHVRHLKIALTGELLFTPLDTPMTRSFDTVTGLKLLD